MSFGTGTTQCAASSTRLRKLTLEGDASGDSDGDTVTDAESDALLDAVADCDVDEVALPLGHGDGVFDAEREREDVRVTDDVCEMVGDGVDVGDGGLSNSCVVTRYARVSSSTSSASLCGNSSDARSGM